MFNVRVITLAATLAVSGAALAAAPIASAKGGDPVRVQRRLHPELDRQAQAEQRGQPHRGRVRGRPEPQRRPLEGHPAPQRLARRLDDRNHPRPQRLLLRPPPDLRPARNRHRHSDPRQRRALHRPSHHLSPAHTTPSRERTVGRTADRPPPAPQDPRRESTRDQRLACDRVRQRPSRQRRQRTRAVRPDLIGRLEHHENKARHREELHQQHPLIGSTLMSYAGRATSSWRPSRSVSTGSARRSSPDASCWSASRTARCWPTTSPSALRQRTPDQG